LLALIAVEAWPKMALGSSIGDEPCRAYVTTWHIQALRSPVLLPP